MLLQIKDMTTLPSRDLIKKQGKIPVIPRRKGAICPGVSDRERYKTRRTVEQFFAHIKEHKRLIARFDKLDVTFFFFALACLNVFKVLWLIKKQGKIGSWRPQVKEWMLKDPHVTI